MTELSPTMTFTRSGIDVYRNPNVVGLDTCHVASLPVHLRTDEWDARLALGAQKLPSDSHKPPYSPYADGGFTESFTNTMIRTRHIMRDRIEDGDLSSRSLFTAYALGTVMMGDAEYPLSDAELIARQRAAIESIQIDVAGGHYQVGIVAPHTDTRSMASCPEFEIITYTDDQPGELVQSTPYGSLVMAQEGDEKRVFERASAAFNSMWEQSVTDPEEVYSKLGQIANSLRLS